MSAAQNQVAMATSGTDAVSFVINLCSSTTPMALTYPATPELKRFSFFVSRRREDGRERFRLHMGYFTSVAEAEEWLALVRDVYPGAWASEAPGKKLRAAQAAAPAAASVAATAPPVPTASMPPTSVGPAPVAAAPVNAAPVKASAPQKASPSVPAKSAASSKPVAPQPAAVRTASATPAGPAAPLEASAPRPAPFVPTLHAPPTLKEPPVLQPAAPRQTAFDESNLREVLAELESTDPALTDTQVLALLEKRGANKQTAPVDRSIRLLKPDDTVTRRVLSDAVQNNAPVSFAVQLQWSVQRVDLSKVPPLAIFNAYTLYTIDGSREGRKWYGLRLGFFSDANSAKQVAQYVRSEFASVAVVPVTPKELEHASAPDKSASHAAATSAATSAASAKAPVSRAGESGQFKLVDDAPRKLPEAQPAAAKATSAPLARVRAAAAAGQPNMAGAAHRSATRDKQPAKPYRAPQTLEETLEILGAGRIEIDNGRGELLNDTSVRHLEVMPQKNSAFGRLLERITERVRKG